MQIFLDYGFTLSGTKAIAESGDNVKTIRTNTSCLAILRGFLCTVGAVVIVVITPFLPIMAANPLYVVLAYVGVCFKATLPDFVFQGLEDMSIITERFVGSQIISTILIFALIHRPSDLLFVPIFEGLASLIAFAWSWDNVIRVSGLSAARNTGLDFLFSKLSKDDEFVAFVDSDDWVESSFVEFLFRLLIDNSAQIAQCGHFISYSDTDEVTKVGSCHTQILNRQEAIESLCRNDTWDVTAWNIAQSDSIAAVPTALALAVQMQKELHDSGTAEAPVLLPQGYDLLRIPMHREDSQPWEESLAVLKRKVLPPFSPRRAERPMLFGADLLEFCTHAVLYLYDHDAERRSAFESLRPLVDPNQYPLFVVDALAEKTDTGYVLNGPLLSELVTRGQYQSAIDTLIDQGNLWEYAPSDRQAVAAYQVALDSSSSPSSSSPSQPPASPEEPEASSEEPELGDPIPEAQTKLVVDGWEKRINEAATH